MNYAKAQAQLKSKFPARYHKYSFNGEIRTYRNKLTLNDDSTVEYIGTTTRYIDHWAVKELPQVKLVGYSSDDLPIPDKINPKKPKTDEYFCYSVRGEKQYYQIYKEWDEAIAREYDIKFLGVCSLPNKVFNDSKNVDIKPRTTTKVKRTKIAEINRPDENHCCYCGILLTNGGENKVTAKTIEHIKPLSKGGTNDKSNLRNACLECNNEKGSMLLPAYIQYLCYQQSKITANSVAYDKLQLKIINANEIAKTISDQVGYPKNPQLFEV